MRGRARARRKARRLARRQYKLAKIRARGERKQGNIQARYSGRSQLRQIKGSTKIKTQWSGTIKTVATFGGIALVAFVALKIFMGIKGGLK